MLTGVLRSAVLVLLSLALAVGGAGCASQGPILVGFAGELTGKRAELGVAGRDGAQLAVDVVNQSGGVNGRPLKLLARNDQGDPDIARQVDTELIHEGVVAIVGHITSEQTAAVLDLMNESRVVLLSPTSSGSQFTGQADHFFRVMPSNELMGQSLAAHIYTIRQVSQLTGIYDLSNRTFTETFWQSVQAEFERLGGRTRSVTFASGKTDLNSLMAQIKLEQPEAVLFIASAVDTALMVQYSQQYLLGAHLFSSTWAQTSELLEKGGRAVEGLEMAATYNPQDASPVYQQFVQRFQARYKRPPDLASAHSYEAVLVLAQALEQTRGQATGLPQALSTIKNLQGVQGLISIDAYGDVMRDVYIVRVESGQFKVIQTISP